MTCVVILVTSGFYLLTSSKLESDFDYKVENTLTYLDSTFVPLLWTYDYETVIKVAKAILRDDMIVEITIRDGEGKPIFSDRKQSTGAEVVQTRPIRFQERTIGEMEVHFSHLLLNESLHDLLWLSLSVWLIALLSIAGLTHIFIRKYFRGPLASFTDLADIYNQHPESPPDFSTPYLEFQPIENVVKSLASDVFKQMGALREGEQKYRRIFESIEDGYILTDMDGTIVSVNPATARMLKYDNPVLMEGKSIIDDVYKDARKREELKTLLMENGIVKGYQLNFRRRDNEVIVAECNIRLVYDELGNPVALEETFRDVTDRKRAEEEKASLEAQLMQAQKMESIGTLAGGIAHDFNNMLQPILFCSEMLREYIPEDSHGMEALIIMEQTVERAKDLVRHILTFSREGEQQKRTLELQLIVREVVKLLHSTLPATIEIRDEIDPNCDKVLADPTQIHQVLMNLCTNAYHAMQESGGVLEVRLFQEEIDDESAKSHINIQPGGYVRLSVSDTGHGIDDVSLDRIFDPFYTTKEEGKGTGLGLSVVHGIVAGHNGTITVESELGEGTSFHIYLPHAEGSSQSEAERDDEIIPKGRERLLFVDDESEIVLVAKMMLGKLGYNVTTRSCGVEALEEFRKDPQRYDVVITDYNMPGMTGLQLSRELIDIRPDIPVILTSGYLEAGRLREKGKSGIGGTLMKPFSPNDLGKAIRRVLDGKGEVHE